MTVLWWIALGNVLVWGVTVGLMFRMAGRERGISAKLEDLEEQVRARLQQDE